MCKKWAPNKSKEHNVQEVDAQKVEKKQCAGSECPARPPERGGRRAVAPRERKSQFVPLAPDHFWINFSSPYVGIETASAIIVLGQAHVFNWRPCKLISTQYLSKYECLFKYNRGQFITTVYMYICVYACIHISFPLDLPPPLKIYYVNSFGGLLGVPGLPGHA